MNIWKTNQSTVIDMAVYSKLEIGVENMLDEKSKTSKREQEK